MTPMNSQIFKFELKRLNDAFPSAAINPTIWWSVCKRLNADYFGPAITEVIKTTSQLYPGSNLLAIVQKKHDELQEKGKRKPEPTRSFPSPHKETDAQRMQRWRENAAPPPPAWAEMKERLKRQAVAS